MEPIVRGNSVLWAAVVALVFFLGGCDESEQGRILRYEKGTYLGKQDTPFTDEQVQKLRQRANLEGASYSTRGIASQ